MLNRALPALAFSALLCTATARSWSPPVEVPDYQGTTGVLGYDNSMTIVNGHPAIATLDNVHRMVRFVRALDAQGSAWGTPVMVNVPAVDGTNLSLCVVNGKPAIAYQRVHGLDLMMVRANDADGNTWGAPVLVDQAGDVGKAASMAVVNGHPAISYFDGTNNRLRYVRANDPDGLTWAAPVNPELLVGILTNTNLVVVNGNPAIGFGRSGNTRYIRAADALGTSWNAGITMVTGLNNGTHTSLAVVAGRPCMAYYKYDDERVAFRRANDANGDAWSAEVTVHHESGALIGAYARVFEVDGNPAVAYQHVSNFDLYYVRSGNASGTSWVNHERVATEGIQGQYIAVQVVDGRPAIAYFDGSAGNLGFVRATNSTGTGSGVWGTPVSMDSHPGIGDHMSQAIVEGYPALAYYANTSRDLRYIRALDSLGTQWGTSVTVDSIGDMGEYCSMTVVNGHPAIAYFDEDDNVRYVRANDPLGASWGSSVDLDNSQSGPRGQGISLKVIGGRPAVAYLNIINGNVRYVRANDVDGTSWPLNGTTIGQVGGSIIQVSLADVGGLPAVAYRTSVSGALMYERGGSVDWTGPGAMEVVVDNTGGPGFYPSLMVVNGRPAISYHDAGNYDLQYVRANDATGATWGTPILLDNDGGTHGSMALVDGRPAVAYRNFTTNLLAYVHATDADGTAWAAPLSLTAAPHSASYASMVTNGPYVGIAFQNLRRQQPWFVSSGGCTPNTGITQQEQTLTADANGANYQWLDCANGFAPISGATAQSLTHTSGLYAVQITYGACTDTSDCIAVLNVAVPERPSPEWLVYPNPASGSATVVAPKGVSITGVRLCDVHGRTVGTTPGGGTNATLNLGGLAPGAYLITLHTDDGSTRTGRLIVGYP